MKGKSVKERLREREEKSEDVDRRNRVLLGYRCGRLLRFSFSADQTATMETSLQFDNKNRTLGLYAKEHFVSDDNVVS